MEVLIFISVIVVITASITYNFTVEPWKHKLAKEKLERKKDKEFASSMHAKYFVRNYNLIKHFFLFDHQF